MQSGITLNIPNFINKIVKENRLSMMIKLFLNFSTRKFKIKSVSTTNFNEDCKGYDVQ